MADLSINSARISDLSNVVTDIEVNRITPDSVQDQEETEWLNADFSTYFGMYKLVPEVKIAFDMRAIWTIGKGYAADDKTSLILENINGWGNDSFNTILKNMIVMKRVAGDSFAEIIRESKSGELINLKTLDPGSIKIIVNKKGIIKRYEQINKTSKEKEVLHKFEPNQIFHLSNKRVADEIHGVSDIEALKDIINANKESFDDVKKVIHRYVKPMMKFILDTDNTAKIDALVTKFDKAVNKGENLYIPKGTVEHDLISVPSNSTLNPLPWRDHLRNYFFQVVGIPQIILGSSGEFTESTAKIAYLAFEQSVEDEQQEIEEQIWHQIGLRIKLSFPASLKNELLSDQAKDKTSGAAQPADTTAGVGA